MTQRMSIFALGAVLAMVFPVAGLLAQSPDPIIGKWELNPEKSKFVPGPGPKRQTRTYVADGDGFKMTAEGINAEGKPMRMQFTAKYDGKDYPVTGSEGFDTISLKQAGDGRISATLQKAGKVVSTGTRVISGDGKELRITTQGTNVKGEQYTNVMVFDKRE